MDAEIAKQTQKLLQKQGMKFKLNTKVTAGDDSGESVKINVEAAKGGKEDVVSVIQRERKSSTDFDSLTVTLCLSPLAAAPTLLASALRTLVLRLMSVAV